VSVEMTLNDLERRKAKSRIIFWRISVITVVSFDIKRTKTPHGNARWEGHILYQRGKIPGLTNFWSYLFVLSPFDTEWPIST